MLVVKDYANNKGGSNNSSSLWKLVIIRESKTFLNIRVKENNANFRGRLLLL